MKVLTANRLGDGEAVWYSEGQRWIATLAGSEVANGQAAEDRLEAIGKAAYRNNEVVDVNLIDVKIVDGEIRPLRLREVIRAAGPTNRTDLGKQARPVVPAASGDGAGI